MSSLRASTGALIISVEDVPGNPSSNQGLSGMYNFKNSDTESGLMFREQASAIAWHIPRVIGVNVEIGQSVFHEVLFQCG